MTDSSTVLQKVRNMLPNPKRVVAIMAFMGCVNTLMAKTVIGKVAETDGEKTYLLTKEGMLRVESLNLVQAITSARNKSGGEVVVEMNFDETTSKGIKGVAVHSPIRISDGLRDLDSDIQNVSDDIREVINEAKKLNVNRVIRKVRGMAVDVAPDGFQDGGAMVRAKAEHPEKPGVYVWAPYHKVDKTGHIKQEYLNGGQGTDSRTSSKYQSTTVNGVYKSKVASYYTKGKGVNE